MRTHDDRYPESSERTVRTVKRGLFDFTIASFKFAYRFAKDATGSTGGYVMIPIALTGAVLAAVLISSCVIMSEIVYFVVKGPWLAFAALKTLSGYPSTVVDAISFGEEIAERPEDAEEKRRTAEAARRHAPTEGDGVAYLGEER
jgi:hypothetical protein